MFEKGVLSFLNLPLANNFFLQKRIDIYLDIGMTSLLSDLD